MALPFRIIDPSRNPDLYEAARYMFGCFGIAYNEETAAQLVVMLEAVHLYQQRSDQYGQLWKDAGAIQEFFNAYRKTRRAYKAIMDPVVSLDAASGVEDDAKDALNYLAFALRNLRAGRIEDTELSAPNGD